MQITISPIHKTFFSGRKWMGLEVEKIKDLLLKNGHQVQILDFSQIALDYELLPVNSCLFYTSSYNENYLQYIKDVIFVISQSRPDIILFPDINQLFSFEDKGYQELYKRRIGLKHVFGKYYGDIEELINDNDKLSYPFVLKKNKGAKSSGVRLIKSDKELNSFLKNERKESFIAKLIMMLKKRNCFRKKLNLKAVHGLPEINWSKFFSKRTPVVTQSFIDGLDCDYKILVFGEKYYSLQRKTRDKDFRASGSGKFSWTVPPTEVLVFAKKITEKMNTPFISLDIGIDKNNKCYLFEFQGIGFGPVTLTASDKYFHFVNGSWQKTEATSELETEYANTINYHLNRLNKNNQTIHIS